MTLSDIIFQFFFFVFLGGKTSLLTIFLCFRHYTRLWDNKMSKWKNELFMFFLMRKEQHTRFIWSEKHTNRFYVQLFTEVNWVHWNFPVCWGRWLLYSKPLTNFFWLLVFGKWKQNHSVCMFMQYNYVKVNDNGLTDYYNIFFYSSALPPWQ